MDKKQISNLHSTLKSSFKAVSDDIVKLKKRDSALREEINGLKKIAPNAISRDEFFEYVKKVDDQMARAVDIDSLTKTEDVLTKSITDVTKKFDTELVDLKSSVSSNKDAIVKRMDSMEKEFKKMIDQVKSEMKKTDDLKKEVKEVRSFKKQVEDLERSFAKKKELDECFDEQDEIYDLIEEMESKILKKKDVEAFQKLVDDKLMKFKSQVSDVESVSDKLNKKMKDFDDYDRNLKSLNEFSEQITTKVSKIDKAEAISNLAAKFKDNAATMKKFETKLNELVEIINKERDYEVERMVESSYYENDNIDEIVPEEVAIPKFKMPEPKALKTKSAPRIVIPETKIVKTSKDTKKLPGSIVKNSESDFSMDTEPKKGFFGKIVDFFFEEVPDDTDDSTSEKTTETKKIVLEKKTKSDDGIKTEKVELKKKADSVKVTKVETKSEVKSETQKESKKVDSKDKKDEHIVPIPKSDEHKEDEPKKRGFFGKIVDWFLEDDDEDDSTQEGINDSTNETKDKVSDSKKESKNNKKKN